MEGNGNYFVVIIMWNLFARRRTKRHPDFSGVCNFDRAANGLVSIELDTWERWVLSDGRAARTRPEQRRHGDRAGWKIFVDRIFNQILLLNLVN